MKMKNNDIQKENKTTDGGPLQLHQQNKKNYL